MFSVVAFLCCEDLLRAQISVNPHCTGFTEILTAQGPKISGCILHRHYIFYCE